MHTSCTVGNPLSMHVWLWEEDMACQTTSYGVANLHVAMERTSAQRVSSHHYLFRKYQLTALLIYSVTFRSNREMMKPRGTRVITAWLPTRAKKRCYSCNQYLSLFLCLNSLDLALSQRIIEKQMLLSCLVTTFDPCHSLGSSFLIYPEARIVDFVKESQLWKEFHCGSQSGYSLVL